MTMRRYAAAVQTNGSVVVTRSTTDSLAGDASLLFDDSLVASKTELRNLLDDVLKRALVDFRAASKTANVGVSTFADGAAFDDGALFAGGAGGGLTYVATVDASSAHTVARDDSDSIGSGALALILDATQGKRTLARAITGLERAILLDSRAETDLSAYPTSGALTV